MQPAVVAQQPGQGVQVGLGEFGQLAPTLDLRNHRVLVADGLKDAGIGRVAGLATALARQAELAEQNLLELLGRAEHEWLADELEDLALELIGLLLHARGDRTEPLSVELGAGLFHIAQHTDERQLNLLE